MNVPIQPYILPSEKSLNLFIKLFNDNKIYLIKDYLNKDGNFNFNIIIGMLLSFACVPGVKISIDLILNNLFESKYHKYLKLTYNLRIELDNFIIKYKDYLTKILTLDKAEQLIIVQQNKFIEYTKAKLHDDHFIVWISFYMTFSALYKQASDGLIMLAQQITPTDLQILMAQADELKNFIENKSPNQDEVNNYLNKFPNLLKTAFKIKQLFII